jgi:single-stranded DNA-binding protein
MIDGLIAGKLHERPVERMDKSGNPYAIAKVRTSTGDGDGADVFVNVIAFDAKACGSLLTLDEGDSVALAGSLTPKVWTDKQGNTRPSVDMVATQVLTAYQVTKKRSHLEGT